jgi:hypothetical protein
MRTKTLTKGVASVVARSGIWMALGEEWGVVEPLVCSSWVQVAAIVAQDRPKDEWVSIERLRDRATFAAALQK